MNIHIKTSILYLFLIFLFPSCKENAPKEFSYTYVLESTSTYKLSFSLNNKKEYTIKKQNFRFEQAEPFQQEGTLTEEEYKRFTSLLFGNHLFKMKDSYGFDKEPEYHIANIIYQVAYEADGRKKFISIRENSSMNLPKKFTLLLKYTNEFVSEHVKE